MASLSASRWAPASYRTTGDGIGNGTSAQPQSHSYQSTRTATTSSASSHPIQHSQLSKQQKHLITRRSDALKFSKLTRRLKWKSRTLLFSYHRALHEREQHFVGTALFPMEDGEAEMMFKIDFFEFYILLERVLVHLLGMFGMVVTAGYGMSTVPESDGLMGENEPVKTHATNPKSLREELMEQHRQRVILGDSKMFHGYAHRFHANVLSALDLPETPLHQLLGTGVVRDYLGIAKEFRNRWKDAEEKPADQREDGLIGSRYEQMLKELNLEEMLGMILLAVDAARPLAEEELRRFASTVTGGANLDEAMMELDETHSDAPWEAMPDAMDWD